MNTCLLGVFVYLHKPETKIALRTVIFLFIYLWWYFSSRVVIHVCK